MKKVICTSIKFFYFFSCFFVIFSLRAEAYIDPSTVTYVIQAVAGVLVAIGAAITISRHKIKAAWRKWYYGRIAKKNMKNQIDEESKEKN